VNFHGMGRQIEFSGNFFIGISIQQKLEDCALTTGQRSHVSAQGRHREGLIRLSGIRPCDAWRDVDRPPEYRSNCALDFPLGGGPEDVAVHSLCQVTENDAGIVATRQHPEDQPGMIGVKHAKIDRSIKIARIDVENRGEEFVGSQSGFCIGKTRGFYHRCAGYDVAYDTCDASAQNAVTSDENLATIGFQGVVRHNRSSLCLGLAQVGDRRGRGLAVSAHVDRIVRARTLLIFRSGSAPSSRHWSTSRQDGVLPRVVADAGVPRGSCLRASPRKDSSDKDHAKDRGSERNCDAESVRRSGCEDTTELRTEQPARTLPFVRPLVFVGRIEQVDERLDDRIGTQG
jgi:hypothetical protein